MQRRIASCGSRSALGCMRVRLMVSRRGAGRASASARPSGSARVARDSSDAHGHAGARPAPARGASAAGGSSADEGAAADHRDDEPGALQLLVRAHDGVAVRVELAGQGARRRQPEAGRERAAADAVDHLVDDLPVERLAVVRVQLDSGRAEQLSPPGRAMIAPAARAQQEPTATGKRLYETNRIVGRPEIQSSR